MINAELIQKIRAEIERRRLHFNKEAEKYQALNNGYSQNCYGARDALRDLENFLSTLEEKSEKPMNQDELDNEIHRFFDECIEVYEVPLYGKVKENIITADCYEITARHFAQWQKEQDDKELSEKIAGAYQLGLADKEKQMMKEARNHFVLRVLSDNTTKKMIELYNDEVDCKFGDKVRVIIVKED